MKILQFIEIGTFATSTDFDNKVGELYQVPVNSDTTPRMVFDVLVDLIKHDSDALEAFSRFMENQMEDNLDKNIFDDCEIIIDHDDTNQYYMIFQLMTVVNIINRTEDVIDE